MSLWCLTAIAATPLLRSTFDEGPGAWTAMGGGGTFRVTRDAADMRDGTPSLEFDYEIGPKKIGVAVLPVPPDAIASMDQIHFWIKTDSPASFAVILSEKGGGNYSTTVWSAGSVWQEVKVEPRDFTLGDRPNDPPDPDGKLDVDQVQGIGIIDLGQMFGNAPPNPDARMAVNRRPGNHTLLISGFEVLSEAATPKDKLVIDQFDAPQLSWLSPGGAAFSIDNSREHAPGLAMRVSYTQSDKAIVYFARNLPPDIPANITHISFDIASDQAAVLVFTLQEKGAGRAEGPKYSTTVEVRGGGKSNHRDLALSALALDPNGPPDPEGALNIARAKTLGIADISGDANGSHGPYALWISNLRLLARD